MTEFVFVEEKPMPGKERPARPGTTIGREGCDVVLADPEVSRRHAVVRQLDTGLAIEDLGSSNGTFVNGERVAGAVALSEGDSVRLGNTVWRLQTAAGATRMAQVQVRSPDEKVPEPPPPAPWADAQQPPAAVRTEPSPASQPPTASQQPPKVPPTDAGGKRGDVPEPDFAPSAIRRVLPASGAGEPPQFSPPVDRRGRGSAARRLEATVISYAVVIATAVAVVAYLAQRS